MLITFAYFGAGCISAVNAHVGIPGHSHKNEVNEEVLGEDWSSEEQNMDHLVTGGTAHFLDHIDSDLEGFRELEDRMNYLKEVLTEHSHRKVIGSEELDNAGFMIHELEEKVMKPFDEHLTALRAQIMKPHVKYNQETLLEISNLIRTSELFLKTAREKVEFVEVMEEVWEVMEEGPGLEDNIASGTKKQVFRKKEHKPWDQELQDKLEVAVSGSASPVAKSEESRSTGKRRTGGADKLQRRKIVKSDPFLGIQPPPQTAGTPHQNAPTQSIVGDVDNQEVKEERSSRGNTPSKGVGGGLGAGSLKDESTAGDIELHPTGSESEETIGPETYDDSVRTAFSAAAKASSEFVQQKVVEHKKVLVAASGLPRYIGLAIVVAAISVVIGMLCIVHRVARARRKINFEGMAIDGEGVCSTDSPCPAASTFLRTPTLASASKCPGYQEFSETQRALESESRLRGWQGVKGAVSDAAAYVTPFRSKVTPRVRNEYKKK